MKLFSISILAALILFSCSSPISPETDQSKIEDLVNSYCNATNERRASDIPELLFPDVFSDDMNELAVVEMFYKQLDATEKFEITDLKFEEDAILLADTGNVKVYCQKYLSNTHVILKPGSPINVFDQLSEEALRSDPTAKIDKENLDLSFTDKKKLVIINHAGKYFLVPDAFFINLETDLFDAKKILSKYLIA